MKARLAMYKGAKLDLAFPITESITAIGRDADNLIQLSDPKVSKRHAVIHAKGQVWTIEDTGSTNGIMVNGAKVKRAELKNGDTIGIGSFSMIFETLSDREEWVPTHVIDMSSQVLQRTIAQDPKRPA